MQKKILSIPEREIEYVLSKKDTAETILFVHGLGASLEQFEKQHQFFGGKYQVLSLSLRGHGNSKFLRKQKSGDFSLHNISQDVIELLDKLKIEKVHFVGNSMGGNIGYEILQANPHRILTLSVFGTTEKMKMSQFTIGAIKLLYKLLGMKHIAKISQWSGKSEYAKNKIYEMFSHTSKETILGSLGYLGNFDYTDVIQKHQVPSLILKGEKDTEINKIFDTTLKAYDTHSNFTLVEMKNAGHFVNLDNPDAFNKKLSSFLKKHKFTYIL